MNTSPIKLTDLELLNLCQQYGRQALQARYKFAGLLPEVARRRLYERKGFTSIYHFAATVAGMSKEQVNRALNLEERFKDKPKLHEALTTGAISINKLAKIASIATVENQEDLFHKAKILPTRALETLVRDEKNAMKGENGNDSVHVNTEMSSELKEKLGEYVKKGININNLLMKLLERHELEIAKEKEQLAAEIQQKPNASRYVPAKIRKHIAREHGTKCSIQTCHKPSQEIHHTQRFALARNHDPHYLAPLCKEHHIIAHSIDQKFQIARRR